jgi:hypothetical protein
VAATIYPPAAAFAPRGQLDFVSQHYLSGSESLRVEVYSHYPLPVPVTVTGRMWSQAERTIKPFQRTYPGPSGMPGTTDTFQLEAGALLNVRLVSNTASGLQLGHLFGRVTLMQGSTGALVPLATLVQGYFDANNEVAWPGTPLQGMHDGRGVIVESNWVQLLAPRRLEETVSIGARWRIVAGRGSIVTSAVAGNRDVLVVAVKASGFVTFAAGGLPVVPASQARAYDFGAGLNGQTAFSNNEGVLPWPDDLELAAGDAVRLQLVNEQVGDAWTGDALTIRQWMDV